MVTQLLPNNAAIFIRPRPTEFSWDFDLSFVSHSRFKLLETMSKTNPEPLQTNPEPFQTLYDYLRSCQKVGLQAGIKHGE